MQALTARRNSDHEHKVHGFPVRCAPVNAAAQQQRRDARCGHARVAGVGQRNAAPDGRCAAERFPVADRIVVGIAVGDNADALLQLDQNAERVGRVIDLCIEQYALGVHQFADLHRQTSRPSALLIRLYRYSPTAPSAQVQVVTWSAAALTSAGALATATA